MTETLVSTEAEYLAWLNTSLAEVRRLVTQKPMTNAAVWRIKTVLDAQIAYNKHMQAQVAYNKHMQAQIAYNKHMQAEIAYNKQHMQRIKTVLDAQIAYNEHMQTAS